MVAMQCGKIHQQFDENELVTSLVNLFRQLALCKIWRGSKETERQRKDVFLQFPLLAVETCGTNWWGGRRRENRPLLRIELPGSALLVLLLPAQQILTPTCLEVLTTCLVITSFVSSYDD